MPRAWARKAFEENGRVAHELLCLRIFVSRVDAALPLPERPCLQRTHRATLAALHLWNYLDRAALLFQPGGYAGVEAAGTVGAREGLSGADVAGDGLVPVVGAGDRGDGHPLLLPSA